MITIQAASILALCYGVHSPLGTWGGGLKIIFHIYFKYWDETLAAIAQHYAETCPRTHDQFNARFNPSKYNIHLISWPKAKPVCYNLLLGCSFMLEK